MAMTVEAAVPIGLLAYEGALIAWLYWNGELGTCRKRKRLDGTETVPPNVRNGENECSPLLGARAERIADDASTIQDEDDTISSQSAPHHLHLLVQRILFIILITFLFDLSIVTANLLHPTSSPPAISWLLLFFFPDPRPGLLGLWCIALSILEATRYRMATPSSILFLPMLASFVTRLLLFASLVVIAAYRNIFANDSPPHSPSTDVSTPIPNSATRSTSSLDARPSTTSDPYNPPKTFSEFFRHFRRLLPFFWPSGPENRRLQVMIVLCLIMLFLGRVVNLLVPIQYKRLVDALSEYSLVSSLPRLTSLMRKYGIEIPYMELILFVFLRFLQGSVGVISTVQNYCWIPVGQFTTREVSIGMFNHLHRLSHRFHMNRKTGEILHRGVASIVSILSSVLFNIYLIAFDSTFGLIVFVTMTLYIIVTIIMTEWRTGYRRTANALDNAMEARAVDSLLNFETVKLYTAEAFEEKISMSQSALNMAQSSIIQVGLLVGCLLCAKRIVVDGTMNIGDFVLYLAYITQLYGPLNWFGNYYRVIQKNFVDMEKMLDLFEENVEIQDIEGAPPLEVRGGEVVFENVSFAYDPRIPPILQDVGGGKSTIFRLILRFYDVQMGAIYIDGQDIRAVQQKSLRMAVGVVPQDTVLFNESVEYNVLYGRPEGTGDDVVEATTAAQIHDRIMSFPDGYETKVGERGLRLSGGEKQRVAIARTLLKNPAIVLLDEATSALDNTTERMVQESLRTLCSRRTTIVIAHRLSTVVDADLILVIKNGRVVERGRHVDLVKMPEGEYFKMWMNQLQEESNGGVVPSVVVEEGGGGKKQKQKKKSK
ncbi:hypothetical protein BC829DRAFT_378930 [Chytridium lagenaria]|nr:hypothetical protein BC829DRAFT_378930 [Chytridium lagenaria]